MIAEKLNAAYAAEALAEANKRLEDGWRPRASGCGGCLREMAHLAAGFQGRPNSPESMRTFELGHQRGIELAKRAKMIWPDAEVELEISVPIPGTNEVMLGHLDLWIPSLRTIVDFKTSGSFKMGLLVGGQEGAGEDYEMQLQAYRHGIWNRSTGTSQDGSMLAFDVRPIRCILVFEGKDSDARKGITAGQLFELEVPHTEELEARFRARMAAIGEIVKAERAGSLDPTKFEGKPKGHWKCSVDKKTGQPKYCAIGPEAGRCF
jgi:hypothetical protein